MQEFKPSMGADKGVDRNQFPGTAIVIVTYNSSGTIESCLNSLFACASLKAIQRVVVVDNASTDGTWSLLVALQERFPVISAIRLPTNVGFGSACNAAFRAHPAEVYVLLNPDCRVIGDSFHEIGTFFTENRDVAIVGLPLVNPDGSPQSNAFDFSNWSKWALQLSGIPGLVRLLLRVRPCGWFLHQLNFGEEYVRVHSRVSLDLSSPPGPPVPPTNVRSVDWVTGAAMALQGHFVAVTGGFDEAIFLYGEDEDICIAARDSGWRVVAVDTIPLVHELGWRVSQFDEHVAALKYESLRYFIDKHYGATLNGCLMRLLLPLQVFGWRRSIHRMLHR